MYLPTKVTLQPDGKHTMNTKEEVTMPIANAVNAKM